LEDIKEMNARRQPSSSGSLSDTDQMRARKQLPPPPQSPTKPKLGASARPQDIAQARPTVLDTIREGPLVVNDADPAGIEPTWRPSFNSAYRFKDGAKEWASHFKTTAGPNLMRVAVWPDGMEW
jgi:hypothetical protein